MKQISSALVLAQSKFRPVNKDSENPFFKSSYADLSSILNMVVPILSSEGIAVSQPMRVEGEKTILCTNLIHTSGELMVSEMILPNIADPQKYGSLITYYKRYQLQAMLGISTTDDDDDANNASSNIYNQPSQYQAKESPKGTSLKGNPASEKQRALVKKLYPDMDVRNLAMSDANRLIQDYNSKGK